MDGYAAEMVCAKVARGKNEEAKGTTYKTSGSRRKRKKKRMSATSRKWRDWVTGWRASFLTAGTTSALLVVSVVALSCLVSRLDLWSSFRLVSLSSEKESCSVLSMLGAAVCSRAISSWTDSRVHQDVLYRQWLAIHGQNKLLAYVCWHTNQLLATAWAGTFIHIC